ncbi:hypothetical protein UFOVP833_4 [uncultured Caudovirales phage]|uniref:Uncharacterized protein n=1 Tax=uncultured Caudovirales phage TaxID=2100421 RepID=A0A6J5SUJ4_9CAUD|nr:hypothetical protein UFOVP833_4 [uncultured Caudovirales phage]CAB4218241.1 hypothetical protein UFOVP1603_21 [uncultured Caudovirales phage]
MSDVSPNSPDATIEDQRTPQEIADYWQDQITYAERKKKTYVTRGKQILKRYKNKRTMTNFGQPLANRRMNVLWSNVQTLKPVLFSQDPKANCARRNKSNKDPVGRVASIVLQNVLQNSIGMEDFSYAIGQVVSDRLLPGAGIALVEYRPEIEQDQVGWQAAETRYIHWEDWITNTARTWQEVRWWGYRTFHTRKECREIALADSGGDEEFADDVEANITLDHVEDKDNKDAPAKATIYTIWDIDTKQVYHIATGYQKAPLGIMPPPVNFDGFLPVPRPLQATTTTDSTYPVPDFDQYVDQADEIDMLTQRIGVLSKSLQAKGIYAGDMESIKQLMEQGDDGILIPVENWMMVMERGGLDKAISWFPVRDIAETLKRTIEARREAIQIMYEITGISDIMRGATEASETASAQQLKAQFGSVRVRESQRDVQRFIRDIIRKKAEVVAEHFELPVIQAMSGVKLLTQEQKQQVMQLQQLAQQRAMQNQQEQAQGLPLTPFPPLPPIPPMIMEAMKEPTWDEVMKLLRDEKLRGFVVDVETDSTIEPDQQAQQASAVQFVTAVTQYLGASAQILPLAPQAAPLLGELLGWATRQWKTADTIEGAIDEFVEQMEKAASAPKPPDPQQQIEQTKAGVAQIEAQTAMAESQIGMQTTQIKAQAEVQKAQSELEGTMLEHTTTMREKQADLAIAKAQPKPGAAP